MQPELIGALALIHVIALAVNGGPPQALGLIPHEPLRWGGLTWFTTFFAHAGAWHLLLKCYFLAELQVGGSMLGVGAIAQGAHLGGLDLTPSSHTKS